MRKNADNTGPFEENTVNFDVPLCSYQMVDAMMDDTATEFDVYLELMQMSSKAPDDQTQAALYEAGQIAWNRMNGNNDD
ncbi:MAG TPA: hypothetical protein VFV38_04630 [Ktedonobacteraceae bacterium]|nr:hypothetical protein [Ktedonobacteraceae bacterium]